MNPVSCNLFFFVFFVPSWLALPLVLERPLAGEDHGQAGIVGGGNDFFVAHRSAGFDDGFDTGFRRSVDAIAEREESIGRHHGPVDRQAGILGFPAPDTGGVNAAHLPGPGAAEAAVTGDGDRITLDMAHDRQCGVERVVPFTHLDPEISASQTKGVNFAVQLAK